MTSTTTSVARAERERLCDLFTELGPDAPTLAGSWTTRDLAAHLLVRERRPDGAAGLVVRALADYGEKVRLTEAERPWDDLVARVRGGPPMWSPTRLGPIDELANTIEFFVHHEDVRRAQPGWEPRPPDVELDDALVSSFPRIGKMLTRRAPFGIVMEVPGRPSITLRRGEPTAAVVGPVGEGVLYLYGRTSVAQVDLDGPSDAVAAIKATAFGF